MASIIRSKDGRKAIQFTSKDGRRPIIRLGKMSEKALAQTHVHVERLIQASIENIAPAPATSLWVADLGDTLHAKLVKAGLVEPRQKADDPDAMTLGEFLEWFVKERGKTRKPGTLLLWQQASKALKDYFGADKLIADISEGDTESWRTWMLTAPRSVSNPKPVAVNTARRRCGMARQFFKAAVRKRWIPVNPFDSLESITVRANRARDHFVSRDDAAKILEACPDQQWRMIFALSRFGGLRCPSETLALRWSDVLWDQNKIRVPSPKTAHHEGKAERTIPAFPELRRELSDGWEIAAPGCEFVITRYRDPRQNLRTTFEKIIRRAGLTPWPKLLHNLRASRQTELAAEFPAHVVCEWIGNSEAVAREHYLRVQESDFERACSGAAKSAAVSSRHGATGFADSVQVKVEPQEKQGFQRFYACTEYAREDSNL